VTISKNVVGNARNGGIATFYSSSHIVVSSNDISQDLSHGSAIYIHGTGATQAALISNNRIQVFGPSPAITTSQGALANSTIESNSISTVNSAGIRILEGTTVTTASNTIRVGGPSGVVYEGTSRGNILNNIITNTTAGLPVDTAQGGIHIVWRSANEPGQYNQIRHNTIVGFPISINDDCWGDHSSLNAMIDNTLDTIYHRGSASSYHGIITSNRANSNANAPVDGTSY
jgi:hypothetical protein